MQSQMISTLKRARAGDTVGGDVGCETFIDPCGNWGTCACDPQAW